MQEKDKEKNKSYREAVNKIQINRRKIPALIAMNHVVLSQKNDSVWFCVDLSWLSHEIVTVTQLILDPESHESK